MQSRPGAKWHNHAEGEEILDGELVRMGVMTTETSSNLDRENVKKPTIN